ncbi:transcription factor grauzone-like [Ochlerotatus camptorhynchus]|uniref:transcription factor grauzone-like n=1 Tax=Ochlerotatus camptorhynchus TaxID=644619 RepID=UPI0031E0D26C
MDPVKQSCRLCLAPSSEQYGSISDSAMHSKLDVVFRFELPLEDSLSTVVCSECSAKIDEFYSYHETVRTNQIRLKTFSMSDTDMLLLVEVKEEPEGEPVERAAEDRNGDDAFNDDEHDSTKSDLDELDAIKKGEDQDEKGKRSMEDNLKIEQFFNGIPCSICSTVSQTFDELKAHSRKKHGRNASVTCCKRKYFKKCLLVQHINAHLDPKHFYCELCKKNYTSKYYLEVHIAKAHANPEEHRYQCNKCGKKFPRESLLTAHLKTHVQVKCTVCERTMANAYSLKIHMQKMHSEGPRKSVPVHICDTCGRSYHQKQTLERHINMQHLGIKDIDRIQCTVCDKWVNSKHYLRIHTRIAHSGENLQVTCAICHQVYPNNRALATHKHKVHTERNLECEICGKKFKLPKHLKEHRAAHMGQRLYSCTVCDYTSNYNGNLYGHMKNKHPTEWAQVKASGGALLAEHTEPVGAEVD